MTLFDRIEKYIKSVGIAYESEEHKLLNEFVAYLGSDKVINGFSKNPLVKNFAGTIIPAQEKAPIEVVEEPAIKVDAMATEAPTATASGTAPVQK